MDTPIETLSFEDALKELERIVSRLESGEATLDESIQLYERGDRRSPGPDRGDPPGCRGQGCRHPPLCSRLIR